MLGASWKGLMEAGWRARFVLALLLVIEIARLTYDASAVVATAIPSRHVRPQRRRSLDLQLQRNCR
jgi:hypothetical protein